MTGPDVSVIICSYSPRRYSLLRAAAASVLAQTSPPAETIVVVDHSPELLALAREDLRGVRLVENAGPRGLAGARNTGLAAAATDLTAFLDDDAVADPAWLERLVEAYADDRVLGVGGRIVPLWETSRPRWCPAEFDWVFGCTYEGMPVESAEVRNMIGANMSFRRAVLAESGGFRASLGRNGDDAGGDEETDACIRVRRGRPGARILYEPSAVVRHRVPATRGSWAYFRTRCYAEGRSKARLSRLVGVGDGLSSERRHVLETLPRGVARGLGDTLRARDGWGIARAGAIVAGLSVTVAGFVAGRLTGVPSAATAAR